MSEGRECETGGKVVTRDVAREFVVIPHSPPYK